MRLRWPFRLALLGLVLGLGAWVTVPAVAQAWRQHQEDRRTAAWVAQLTPPWRALSAMPDPAGLTGQPRSDRFTPNFVWYGTIKPHPAALRFRSALVAVGATDAKVRCLVHAAAPQRVTLCRVDAVLAGVAVTANVGPGLRPSGGLDETSTQVGLDLGLTWPLKGAWAKVAVE